MKNRFFRLLTIGSLLTAFAFVGCNNDDNATDKEEGRQDGERWITIAGAKHGDNPGDGNGGTMIYSVSEADAKDPNKEIRVFEDGFNVRSQRTARLQISEDGNTLFNIAYAGDNGGEFSTYRVEGGNNFVEYGAKVSIAEYAGTSPRWAKLFDGDQTGVAVNVSKPLPNTGEYEYTRGLATVLALDLKNAVIAHYEQYEIPLTTEEENQGYHIFRLDAPVLNKAKNKLIIGTWMRKTDPETGENDANTYERLGAKSVVVDYPSLTNPTVITSTNANGDTSGYRSFNSFVADDGNIYQATQRDVNGSKILRINQSNKYDNSYVFSLDSALGVTDSYVESWRYAGNGIAYVMYTHNGSEESALTGNSQSFLARVDLFNKTAEQVDLPYDADLYSFQYQGFAVVGDEVYVAIAPVGKNGNIYILNSKTGEVKKGAKLINESGNHFIGAF